MNKCNNKNLGQFQTCAGGMTKIIMVVQKNNTLTITVTRVT